MRVAALLATIAAALVQLPSGLARAEAEAIVHVDSENAAVDLVSVGPPESTEIYTWRGVISVRLYGVDTGDRDVMGDGDAIEKILLRHSRRGFSVLRIELTDHRLRVDKNSVHLEVAPTNFRVTIPRALLPNGAGPGAAPAEMAQPTAAQHPAAEHEPPQVDTRAAADEAHHPTVEPGEPHAPPSAAHAGAPSAVNRSATSSDPGDAHSEPADHDAKSAKPKPSKIKPHMKPEAPAVSSYVWVLLLLSLCLGLMYGLIRLIAARSRAFSPNTPINVLSAKRLGPRHQLVIVRALGEDHLLSVQGGQTLLISSTPTSAIPDGSGGALDEPTVDIQLPTKLPFSSAVAGILRLRGTQTE